MTIEEVGNGYIEELVKRNMVISKRDVTISRFETCHLHDMMREVCLLQAEKKNFVHVVDTTNSQSPCKSRRIAVHQLDSTYDPKREIQNPKLRSLLFINQGHFAKSGLWFTRLQLMRVLDLSRVDFGGKLPSSIGKPIHLRYLSLYKAYITHPPSSMRNLKLLLYLNLDVQWGSPIHMPNFMKEIGDLTYLHLPWMMHDKTKLELGNLVNLESLNNFSTNHSSVEDLQRMTKLRILSIIIRGQGCNIATLSSSISELPHLEDLSIDDKGVFYAPRDDKKQRFVLNSFHLKKLSLTIYMPKLPDKHHFPSQLITIFLEACWLVEDPMPILEKLLELTEVRFNCDSFCGKRMVCSSGGFPQLQKLRLHGLDELEEWVVEKGSMPLLHTLSICPCLQLKELPDGLRFISSLKNLTVDGKWKERLSEGGEDYYKVQHIPSVTCK